MRKSMIVAVLGMVLAIAACGPGAEPTPTPTATPRPVVATPTPTAAPLATATATPKRGGILKVRYAAAPTVLYIHQTTSGQEFTSAVYNTLVAEDPLDPTSEKIVPDLADRWEISGDGLTYTFFLHQGVKWSDGIPFTATDVKYIYDLVRNPPTDFISLWKGNFDAVAAVSTPDDKTVVLKMKSISNTILGLLAAPTSAIAPKHIIEKDVPHALDKVMVGTGPYLFKRLTPEGIFVYERNPSYWKPGLPYLDGIQIIPITDPNAFIAALYTGQVDESTPSARALSKTDVQRIRKEHPELIQGSASTLKVNFLALNAKTPLFKDQRVRTAVQDSIDRVLLESTGGYDAIVGGMKIPGTFWALPAEELAKLPGFGPDISARRERARQLLKDAGIAAGTEFALSAKTSDPLNMEIGELIQLQLREALPSLNVKIRNYSKAEFNDLEASGGLHAWFDQLGPSGPDPDFFGIFYTTGGSRNTAGTSDPRIDELQLKQSSILDPVQRRLAVWDLDKLVIQYGAFGPVFWRKDICVAWPHVKNQVCTASTKGIFNRYEVVWLDK